MSGDEEQIGEYAEVYRLRAKRLQRQVQERDKRIKLKREEIAAEVRSYDAQTSVKNSWRADRQRMLDWLDGLLEAG